MERGLVAEVEEFDYYTRDSLSEFITIMKQYPKATDASNMELLRKYRQGDMEARDILIKTNLRFIVSQARNYVTHSYELLDVINENVIGFMRAIDDYDETRGVAKLTTFAAVVMRHHMGKALSKNDYIVRRPKSFISQVKEYYRIVKVFMEEGKPLPNDEEFCKLLHVTPRRFSLIRSDYQFQTSSLDEKISDDEDSEILDFVAYEETGFDNFFDIMEDKRLLLSIKLLLSPLNYYIFYHRVFSQEVETREEIAKRFYLSISHVGRIERNCVEILRTAISRHGGLSNLELPSELERNLDDINAEPIDPDLIAKYLFFRDALQDEERTIFKLLITSNYLPNDSRFIKKLGMDYTTYKMFYKSLMEKIEIKDSLAKSLFGEFKRNIMKQFGHKIFTMDLDMDLEDSLTGTEYVARVWDSFTYDDAIEIIRENNILLTPRMDKLLLSYFDAGRERFTLNTVSRRKAEREVNAILFGFHKRNEVTITGLFDSLLNNKHRFTLNQYDYLMSRKFNQDNLLDRGIVRVSKLGSLRELSRKLEKIHYGISRYRELNFTKSKYEAARAKCLKVLPSDRISILDKFYGIESPKYSIQQIADEEKISYEEARSNLQEAKRSALRIYLGRHNTKIIEESYYIPYILDDSIDLSDETRTMLREFLIEKKSYEEIERLHGIDKRKKNQQRRVATVIASGLLKIDYYRFGIYKLNAQYTQEECSAVLKKSSLTAEEKKVIKKKMAGKTKEKIMKETGLTFIRVSYILNKFYRLCDEQRIASVEIDEADIKREVNAHISEMVLNERERLMLAKLYGVVSDVNPMGKVYTEQEFRLEHPNMSKQYKRILKNALDTVRSKKAGYTRASLAYMSRDDLKLSLKDPRIPISQKERELLYYSFELEGYPYKTLKELEEVFGEKADSLKQRVERTFVTIYKYENDELSSSISYEYDVEPYLKYFSKSDQEVLKDFYDRKLTYEEISKKHELTKGQVESLILSLDSYLRDLIDEEVCGYDFDYFWSVINIPTIPFYGNKAKVQKIFYLYYEQRMSVNEIIEFLGLNCARSVVVRAISDLMIAVSKYKEGIKKVKCPKEKEIKDYYERNHEEMDLEHRQMYQQYFERMSLERKKATLNAFSEPTIPAGILLDLIGEQQEHTFSFQKTSKKDAIDIIKKHKELTNSTRYTILRAYHINQRELLSGSEKMKVLRFLSKLDINQKILALRKSA